MLLRMPLEVSIIVALSQMIMDVSGAMIEGMNISVLRGFRLLRVFKLARNWVSLRKLLETILQVRNEGPNSTLAPLFHSPLPAFCANSM